MYKRKYARGHSKMKDDEGTIKFTELSAKQK